ncbi:3204_t:CDS:2 [Rhizophagus irregularis]|nr:3204_t:CDS:2 [Rhizophagus irregularis]
MGEEEMVEWGTGTVGKGRTGPEKDSMYSSMDTSHIFLKAFKHRKDLLNLGAIRIHQGRSISLSRLSKISEIRRIGQGGIIDIIIVPSTEEL